MGKSAKVKYFGEPEVPPTAPCPGIGEWGRIEFAGDLVDVDRLCRCCEFAEGTAPSQLHFHAHSDDRTFDFDIHLDFEETELGCQWTAFQELPEDCYVSVTVNDFGNPAGVLNVWFEFATIAEEPHRIVLFYLGPLQQVGMECQPFYFDEWVPLDGSEPGLGELVHIYIVGVMFEGKFEFHGSLIDASIIIATHEGHVEFHGETVDAGAIAMHDGHAEFHGDTLDGDPPIEVLAGHVEFHGETIFVPPGVNAWSDPADGFEFPFGTDPATIVFWAEDFAVAGDWQWGFSEIYPATLDYLVPFPANAQLMTFAPSHFPLTIYVRILDSLGFEWEFEFHYTLEP